MLVLRRGFTTKSNHSAYSKLSKKLFKNKIVINEENMQINKSPTHLKLVLQPAGDLNILKKSFLFDNQEKVDSIVEKIEQEYNINFVLEEKLKAKLERLLVNETSYTFNPKEYSAHLQEFREIANKLKIDPKNLTNLIGELLSKSSLDIRNQTHLKILHFNILSELKLMETKRKRIEESATRRVTFYLMLLALVLIIQTGVFYHLIFHVDHLGWDLMEPATFLFGSVVFILGVFSYVKLQKNAISGERIFQDFTKNILMRNYIKRNFNVDRFNSLNTQLEIVKRILEQSKRI